MLTISLHTREMHHALYYYDLGVYFATARWLSLADTEDEHLAMKRDSTDPFFKEIVNLILNQVPGC